MITTPGAGKGNEADWFERAVGRLRRGDVTSWEMARWLRARGVDKATAHAVITRLKELH